MNVTQLPTDILIIIIENMNKDIMPLSIVNKTLYQLSQPCLKEQHEKYIRKKAFFYRCTELRLLIKGFNCVESIEECEFLHEAYNEKFGSGFIPRVRYIMLNTLQIATENWFRYLQIYRLTP
jgi:hypothetical protein